MFLSNNTWKGGKFDSTYEPAVDLALNWGLTLSSSIRMGAWPGASRITRGIASRTGGSARNPRKLNSANMCCTLDFQVAQSWW